MFGNTLKCLANDVETSCPLLAILFSFIPGGNTCKKGFECLPISEVYKTARDFCEKVWDHSWKFIPDDVANWSVAEPPCMHLRGANIEAHNRDVAKLYATVIMDRLHSAAASPLATGSLAILLALVAGSLSWASLF
ncbi:unnamed protein product [Dibothriocephalus latus]|uniref:Uncharacterized protein n=1 Tax=Dibothriocephalus latus TaxID=60516 RepID=A0A3P7MA32_DIBLA|nr:unnamed protein product [Dibothriocephalus latus]